MGKHRRVRQKLHISSSNQKSNNEQTNYLSAANNNDSWSLLKSDKNIFEGININLDTLKNNLNDDVKSIKSVKSQKSLNGASLALKKKDKLKLRKQKLLHKIDTVNQLKKELKLNMKKKKQTPLMSDMFTLKDALPSLEPLKNKKSTTVQKVKGIQKASKRKKDDVNNVRIFKKCIKLNTSKPNSLNFIQSHIESFIAMNQ